jgi:tryptophan-rich sensory protein
MILAPSCVWLTVAVVLVFRIWQLNGREPLYPVKLTVS